MNNIINTYPVFESSQVLTNAQLNQLVSYLDQQTRLSRVKLVGMGIVCGLELSYEDEDDEVSVTISKGTAITSEGFLISLGECETLYYRPYELPEGVEYHPFGDPGEEIEMHELLREIPENPEGVLPLGDDPDFLDDKYVLLFLEIFDNDLKSCLGNTCDESGIDRIFNVRKLLVDRESLDDVLTRSANVGPWYPGKLDLPDIVMPRTLFDPEEDHSRQYEAFGEHYSNSINGVFSDLFGGESTGALHETYTVYEDLLGPAYDFDNPFENETIGSLIESWLEFLDDSNYRGIQYLYGFLKDVILAYNEFRETAFDLMSECSPDMSLFPKHVMLGKVLPEETEEDAETYRHGFSQSPIYNKQKHLAAKALSLHQRLVLLVEKFDLERVNQPPGNGDTPLRITPSDEKKPLLSIRSIPYYYNSKEASEIVSGTLEQYWNFDITRMKPSETEALVLSYENQSKDQAEAGTPLETPLFFDTDNYPFLRIEGHFGQNVDEMMESINAMKANFDLPFDLVALQLNPEADLLEPDFSCGFEDVQEDYIVAQSALCSFAKDFSRLVKFIGENPDNYFESEEEQKRYLDRLEEPLQLLVELCESLPECVDEFAFEKFRPGYKALLQLIIYFNLLDENLLDDMYTGRAASLYDTFLQIHYAFERRRHYLQDETKVFSSFIQKHPGVEHQAGVYKGGTFILVYVDSEAPEVVADFNLPYLCCGTENCVPACEEEGSDFEFEVPPVARPDYAVTTVNTAVDIHAGMNDYDFLNSDLIIGMEERDTENGGQIKLFEDAGVIRYQPNEGFIGMDSFTYKLINKTTETGDTGMVTVLVKEEERQEPPEEPRATCYDAKILSCWGQNNVRFVLDMRNIGVESDQSIFEALLNNLRTKGAFTRSELKALGEDRRGKLLDCIAPQHPEMNDAQIMKSIEDYQNANCGSRGDNNNGPRIELRPNDATRDELMTILSDSRGVEFTTDATREDLDSMLIDTRHGMRLSREEISMFTKDRIMRMLKNREADFSSSSTKSELIDLLFKL